MNYWQRLQKFQQFGVFIEPVPVAPSQWVYTGLEEHEDGLRTLLTQDVPKRYSRFFYHLLVLEYEIRPIEKHAAEAGIGLHGIGVDGGWFLWSTGKQEPITMAPLRTRVPILESYKEIEI